MLPFDATCFRHADRRMLAWFFPWSLAAWLLELWLLRCSLECFPFDVADSFDACSFQHLSNWMFTLPLNAAHFCHADSQTLAHFHPLLFGCLVASMLASISSLQNLMVGLVVLLLASTLLLEVPLLA
jgi:hypothetical protein